jgi:hypothetical protein
MTRQVELLGVAIPQFSAARTVYTGSIWLETVGTWESTRIQWTGEDNGAPFDLRN